MFYSDVPKADPHFLLTLCLDIYQNKP